MAFFRFRWLRSFVRRHTKPIPYEVALNWKEKLSIAYMLISWNLLGVVLYYYFTRKSDWPKYYGIKSEEEANKMPAVYFAELLGIKKARIISVSGFTKTGEFYYDETSAKESNIGVGE